MTVKRQQQYKATTVIFPVGLLTELKELAAENNRSLAGQIRAMLIEQLSGKKTA